MRSGLISYSFWISGALISACGGGSGSDEPESSAHAGSGSPMSTGGSGSGAGTSGAQAHDAGTGGGSAGSSSKPTPDAGTAAQPAQLSFVPSNLGAMIAAHADGAQDVRVVGTCHFNSADGVGDCDVQSGSFGFFTLDQPGAEPPNDRIGVFIVNDLEVGELGGIFIGGPSPTAIVALGDMTIDGTITAGGGAWSTTPGPGQGDDVTNESFQTYGAEGGEHCGRYSTAELTPLLGGSSGGSSITVAGKVGAQGGRGGGALQLIAGGTLSISGAVNSTGDKGEGCSVNNGAGGGGSGGAILIEAPTVVVSGEVSVAGGEATTLSCDTAEEQSKAGGFGRVRINSSSGKAEINASAVFAPELSSECISQGTLATSSSGR